MKTHASLTLIAALAILLCATNETQAQRRGGGGGGRGGGGRGGAMHGGGGGRPSVNRSPSMSRMPSQSRPQVSRPQTQRPASRPAQRPAPRPAQRPSVQRPGQGGNRPATLPGQRPGSRPQTGGGFLDRPSTRPTNRLPGAGNRPGTGTRPGGGFNQAPSRDQIKSNIGNHPGQRPNMPSWFDSGASSRPAQLPNKQPGNLKPGNRPVNRPANRPGVRPPVTRHPGVRPPGRRPPYAGHLPHRPGYGRPWYPNHPGHGRYRPGYWWRPATAIAVTAWVANRWNNPIYYSYGTGGSVYYEDNSVYVDGEQYCTAEQYYEEASTIASSAPEITEAAAEDMEWLPLGVFALTGGDVGASQMYLQLAMNKDSVISGTFYNETTGVTYEVEGYVDADTQRAAWYAPESKNPNLVMETGVYNLTKDEADVLVHFGPDQTQTWKMVRLDESERPAAEAPE